MYCGNKRQSWERHCVMPASSWIVVFAAEIFLGVEDAYIRVVDAAAHVI